MDSAIFGRAGNLPTTGTQYCPLGGNFQGVWLTTETDASVPMSTDGKLRNFAGAVPTAPGAGTSWSLTLMKNGVATALTFTIADTATSGSDATHEVSYVEGDVFSIRCVVSGTPTAATGSFFVENVTLFGQTVICAGSTTVAATASVSYAGFSSSQWVVATTSLPAPVPTDGTVSHLQLRASVTTGAAKSWKATLVKNGVDTALVATITNGQVASNTADSVAVVAGDTLYWRLDPTSNPASARVYVSARFTPTIDGESIFMFGANVNLATSGNNFSGEYGGSGSFSTTENLRANWLGPVGFQAKKLYITLDAASAAAKSWTGTLRSNLADTALTTNLAQVTANHDTTHTVTPTQNAYLDVNIVGTGTPAGTHAQWGFVLYKQAVNLGQPSGTNTAQPVAHSRSYTLGEPVGVNTAQPVTRQKTLTTGQPATAETAQPLARVKALTIGQATEADTSQPATGRRAYALLQALEASVAQAVGRLKTYITGLNATEVEGAQPIQGHKSLQLEQATETGSALGLTSARSRTLGEGSSTETAQSITRVKSITLSQAVEGDSASRFPRFVRVHQVAEGEQPFGIFAIKPFTQPFDVEIAQPITAKRIYHGTAGRVSDGRTGRVSSPGGRIGAHETGSLA